MFKTIDKICLEEIDCKVVKNLIILTHILKTL